MRYGLMESDVVVQVQPRPGAAGEWVELPAGVTNGARRHNGGWTAPPSSDYQWDGTEEAWVLSPPAQARQARLQQIQHRLDRKEDYRDDLGEEPENDYIDTVGDCIDAIFKECQLRRENGETLHPELVDKLDKWLAVKARHPKPPGPA